MLSVKNIVVHYGGIEALKGVSVEIEKASITTLIGANGAGKSTLLKAISGLVPLTSGEIWFEGRRIDGIAPEKIAKIGIAHIPEGRRLFPYMSTFDNLMIGAYVRKDKVAIKRDLEKSYEYFPILRERRRNQARYLSGGEQQMLAFGRGLLVAPKLFIFDEPSLGLAPMLVSKIADSIVNLAREGHTIVLVEQNAKIALEIADKAYVLEMGKIVMQGPAKELRNSDYVKKIYLGI